MRVLLPLIAIALAMASAPAAAQAPSEAQVTQARQLFEQADEEFASRRFQSAANLFQQSYDLLNGHENQYLVLFNIGQSLASAGDYDAAIAAFRRYLAEGGSRIQNRGEVDQRIAELEELRGGDDGGGGGGGPPPSSGPDEGLLAGSIAALGLGVVGLAGMGIFGGLALAEHDALANGCGATRSCTESDVATSDTFAVVADVNLGIGAAALTAGVVLLILALTSSSSDEESAFQRLWQPNGLGGAGVIRW